VQHVEDSACIAVAGRHVMEDAYDEEFGERTQRKDLEKRLEGEAAEGVLPVSDKGSHVSVKPCRDVISCTSVHQWSREALSRSV